MEKKDSIVMTIKNIIFTQFLVVFLFINALGHSQPENNDSLNKLKIEQIQQEIIILQNRFNRLYSKLDQNTKQLIDRTDSNTSILLSETTQVKENQNTAFSKQTQQIATLKNELKSTREDYQNNSLRLYFLLSVAILLLIAVFVLLYQIRKRSVEVLVQKSDKIFNRQSEIHEKTTKLLNLHTEISEAIDEQQSMIKKQKKSAGKAAKKAVKDVIKRKYRTNS